MWQVSVCTSPSTQQKRGDASYASNRVTEKIPFYRKSGLEIHIDKLYLLLTVEVFMFHDTMNVY